MKVDSTSMKPEKRYITYEKTYELRPNISTKQISFFHSPFATKESLVHSFPHRDTHTQRCIYISERESLTHTLEFKMGCLYIIIQQNSQHSKKKQNYYHSKQIYIVKLFKPIRDKWDKPKIMKLKISSTKTSSTHKQVQFHTLKKFQMFIQQKEMLGC